MLSDLFDKPRGLSVVYRIDSLENLHSIFVLPAGIDQRFDIFRETTSAESHYGKQKCRVDSRVGRERLTDHVHVGSDRFAKIGDLVHERDASREKRVGRILQQFGCSYVDQEYGASGPDKR